MIRDTCPSNENANEYIKSFKNTTGLEIKPCSVKIIKTQLVRSNYTSNKLIINMDISSGSQININYILLTIVALLQFWFLIFLRK